MAFTHFNINKSVFLLITQIVYSGKSFLLAFLLARYFDKSSFGIYAFIIICLNNYLGFLNNLVYEPLTILKNEVAASYKEVIAYLFRRQSQINLVVLLIFAVLAIFKTLPVLSLTLIFLFLLSSQFHEFFKRIYLTEFHTGTALNFDIILACTQFSLLFLFYSLRNLTLDMVFLSLLLGSLPTILYGVVKHKEIFSFSNTLLNVFDRRYFDYIKPNLLFSFVSFCSSQLNNFVIFLVLGSVALANCEAIRLLMIPLHLTILAMGNILLPYFSRNIKVLGAREVKLKLKRFLLFFVMVFAGMALLVIIGGPFLLDFFYQGKYTNQFFLLIIYALIYVFDGMNAIITYYLKAKSLINIGVNIRMILSFVNVALLIPLVFLFREAGGLLALMVTCMLLFVSYYRTLINKELI